MVSSPLAKSSKAVQVAAHHWNRGTCTSAANAVAYAADEVKFKMDVQGIRYLNLPVSRYRVHCLEKLREAYAGLNADARDAVRTLLPHPAAAVLWQTDDIARSGYDEAGEAPFNKAINVYGNGVPD